MGANRKHYPDGEYTIGIPERTVDTTFGPGLGEINGASFLSRLSRDRVAKALGMDPRTGAFYKVFSDLSEDAEEGLLGLPEPARDSCLNAYRKVCEFCAKHKSIGNITEANIDEFYDCASACILAHDSFGNFDIPGIEKKQIDKIHQVRHLFTPFSAYDLNEYNNRNILDSVVLDPEVQLFERLQEVVSMFPQCLMSLSEIESGTTSKNRFDTMNIVREICEKHMSIIFEGESEGLIDASILRNLCVNIITNFVKYGKPNTGKITITFGTNGWSIDTYNEKSGNDKVHTGGVGGDIMKRIVEDNGGSYQEIGREDDASEYELRVRGMNYAS